MQDARRSPLPRRPRAPRLSQLSALLADDLAGVEDELVIVLDDFHLIQEPSIHALLSLLVRRLPPTIQLVIASREEPPLPVALLRGRRELAEVRADDLRFDRAEAIAFVREMSDAPLDLRRVADAVDRSEGWAVGLRLLTLVSPPLWVLADQPDAGRRLASGSSWTPISSNEVLSRQTPSCTIPDPDLDPGPLLRSTLRGGRGRPAARRRPAPAGREHGRRALPDVARRRAALVPLPPPVPRHAAPTPRARCGSEARPGAAARASDWLAGQGLWDEAATQAIDANDVGRVTALVETCLMTERSIGAGLMLESWTRRLPRDVVAASPTLSLARCGRLGRPRRGGRARVAAASGRSDARR